MLLLGGYGFYDEWYNVLDFLTGIANVGLLGIAGLLFFFAVFREKYRKINYAAGGVFVLVGAYGLYDEWQAFADLFYGVLPFVCILVGALSLASGLRQLKT